MSARQVIIDVREPEEYAGGHADGAVNVPLSTLMDSGAQGEPQLQDVPKDAKLVLYCNSGNRSGVAAKILKRQGFTDVENGINQRQVEKG